MAIDLRGKHVVIVGCSSGIGRALAHELAREGAVLSLFARRAAELAALADEVKALGSRATVFAGDTADPAQVEAAHAQFARAAPIDGLVFSAGTSHATAVTEDRVADARAVLETNFFGLLQWTDRVLPSLIERRTGFVAGVTALCAYRGIPSGGLYAASKGAASNYLESLRLDLEPHGVAVYELMPGFVKTPMSDKNNVSMPFMIGAPRAARACVRAFRRGRGGRVEFGRAMSWVMWVVRNLPGRVYDALCRSFVRRRYHLQRFLSRCPPFLCPADRTPLRWDRYGALACPTCARALPFPRDRLDLLDGTAAAGSERSLDPPEAGGGPPSVARAARSARSPGAAAPADPAPPSERNLRIRFAYGLYSIAYPVIALLAMKLVWKGTLRHQVTFYADRIREASDDRTPYLDVATGDGALKAFALRAARLPAPPSFLAVDLSPAMLRKAARRFAWVPEKLLYVQDVNKLNLPDGSFGHALCYGGIHVFSQPVEALRSVRRLLRPDGVVSGSILLRPGRPWADRLVERAIGWGLLSTSMTEEEVDRMLADAGLRVVLRELNGRMLLFKAVRADAAAGAAGAAGAAPGDGGAAAAGPEPGP